MMHIMGQSPAPCFVVVVVVDDVEFALGEDNDGELRRNIWQKRR
jgi:hypothetical protein